MVCPAAAGVGTVLGHCAPGEPEHSKITQSHFLEVLPPSKKLLLRFGCMKLPQISEIYREIALMVFIAEYCPLPGKGTFC